MCIFFKEYKTVCICIYKMKISGNTDIITNTDMAIGNSPVLDVTLVPGGKQASNISPFLTALPSLELPVVTAHKPFCLFFSPILPLCTFPSY